LARNSQDLKLGVTDIRGKRTLVLGESGSGKTRLVAKLVEQLMTVEKPDRITIIDFAPKRTGHLGGKLTDYSTLKRGVRYLAPKKVCAPRLTGASPEQVLRLARLNRRLMEPLLSEFIQKWTEILIINDVTLYLHAGKLERILQSVRLADTFLGTAYYGSKLAEDLGTGISLREKGLTNELAAFMDRVVKIV
jgi:energy-coupling factor transporter ATP-binding protein EcfA2